MANCPDYPPPCPSWMVSYGNIMTLLVCFFIVLLTFSHTDKIKFEQVTGALKDAFGVDKSQDTRSAAKGSKLFASEFTQEIILVRLMEKLQVVLAPMIDKGTVEIVEQEDGYVIKMNLESVFDKGSMRINNEMEPVLQQVANQLASIPNLVNVTGHTDNRPVDPTGPYPNNWAISVAHSAAVVNFFTTKGGVDPTRLQARGMGAFAPRQSNDTPEGRAANRRIEMMISRQTQLATSNKFVEGSGLSDDTDLAEITSGVER